MKPLEETARWANLTKQKNDVPLIELAERFNVTPGRVAAALQRTRTVRVAHAPAVPQNGATNRTPQRRLVRPDSEQRAAAVKRRSDSAPEDPSTTPEDPSTTPEPKIMSPAEPLKASPTEPPTPPRPRRRRRSGGGRKSKVHPYLNQLGTLFDSVIAEKAGVTASAVGRYRRELGIAPVAKGRTPARLPTPEPISPDSPPTADTTASTAPDVADTAGTPEAVDAGASVEVPGAPETPAIPDVPEIPPKVWRVFLVDVDDPVGFVAGTLAEAAGVAQRLHPGAVTRLESIGLFLS